MIQTMATAAQESIWSYAPGPGDLEPFDLGEGDAGALLIHGFCGTPPEMRGLGEHLASQGFRVRGVLLPGHGTDPEDLDRYRWGDWLGGAQRDLDALKRQTRSVFVAGQSMGGALALKLAADNPDVAAVASMSALVTLGWNTETLIRVGRRVRRWHYTDSSRVDLWDAPAVALLRSYTKRSMASHWELLKLMRAVRASLPSIRVPALVMHGRRDQTVPPINASLIGRAIGDNATVRYFERSGHAMSVDVDKDEIFGLVTEHFENAVRPSG
jgi:carboxylesterase